MYMGWIAYSTSIKAHDPNLNASEIGPKLGLGILCLIFFSVLPFSVNLWEVSVRPVWRWRVCFCKAHTQKDIENFIQENIS